MTIKSDTVDRTERIGTTVPVLGARLLDLAAANTVLAESGTQRQPLYDPGAELLLLSKPLQEQSRGGQGHALTVSPGLPGAKVLVFNPDSWGQERDLLGLDDGCVFALDCGLANGLDMLCLQAPAPV
jgi:hypothetical protein